MKDIKLYREDNGQYSTSEAQQDDVSGHYVQKTDYDQLKRKNAELRANIDKMESLAFALENSSDKERDINMIVNAAYKLPNQHLADIKADAVIEASELHKRQIQYEHGHYEDTVIFECDLLYHAEKLRGETK